jgi:gamma-glutamyl AIG2-like cyclotransferase
MAGSTVKLNLFQHPATSRYAVEKGPWNKFRVTRRRGTDMTEKAAILLFCYGTLRQEDVQIETFGRRLEGQADALAGFALAPMTITDPHVVEISGLSVHTIAGPSGNPGDRIPGVVFTLTAAEMEAADRYEAGPIERIRVRLESGAEAFVYVAA